MGTDLVSAVFQKVKKNKKYDTFIIIYSSSNIQIFLLFSFFVRHGKGLLIFLFNFILT